MAKNYGKLQQITDSRKITQKTNPEFWYQLQSALLLALREQGRLSPMEHRYAQERLKQQPRERAADRREAT